jgi:hypothetical protein
MSSRFYENQPQTQQHKELDINSNGKYISLMKLKKLLNNLDTTTYESHPPQTQQITQPQIMQQPIVLQPQIPTQYGYQTLPIQTQNNMELSSNARMEIQNMIDRQAEITEKNIKEYVTLNSEKLVSYIKELLQYNQTVEKANRLKEEQKKEASAAASNSNNGLLSVMPESITSAFNTIKNAISTNTKTTPPTPTPPTPSPPTPTPSPTPPSKPTTNTNQTAEINSTPHNTTTSNQAINTVHENNNLPQLPSENLQTSRLSLNNGQPKAAFQPVNTENNTIDEDLITNSTQPQNTTALPIQNNINIEHKTSQETNHLNDGRAPRFDYNAAENELNEKKKKALAQEQLNRVNSEIENLGFMKGGMKNDEKKKRSQKKNIKNRDKSKKKLRKN